MYAPTSIPANFFWVKGVRFLSWKSQDFRRRHDHVGKFPMTSKVFRRWSETFTSSSPRTCFAKHFLSELWEFWESIIIYLFYTEFSFLALVWVYIFFGMCAAMVVITHFFQLGVRNWVESVSWHEIEVFNSQAWDSRLRRESWQVNNTMTPVRALEPRLLYPESSAQIIRPKVTPPIYESVHSEVTHVTVSVKWSDQKYIVPPWQFQFSPQLLVC